MNDEFDIQERPTDPIPVAPVAPVAGRHGRTMARAAVIGGSLLLGAGAIAAAVAGPVAGIGGAGSQIMTLANSTTTGDQSTGTQPGFGPGGVWGGGRGPGFGGMMGGRHEVVSDLSVAAQAIGMTESELQTALQGGQTLAQVATSKGVAVQKVIDALVADQGSEIDAAVKAGRITQAQADQMKTNVTAQITARVNGTFAGPGVGMGRGHGMMGPGEDLSVVAKAIGMSDSDLLTALQGGKSIADVAKSKSVAVQTVIDALVASEKTEVQALVTAGRITQTQADTMIANLTQRATAIVNGTFSGPGRGFGGGMGHGWGHGWGHDWNGQAPNGTNQTSPNASPSTNGA